MGESATIRGEIVADDIVVNGRVIGRVRGLKVRLTATARVEGDIIHKTIAIESGAHFEGSVQRQEDPLAAGRVTTATLPPMRGARPRRKSLSLANKSFQPDSRSAPLRRASCFSATPAPAGKDARWRGRRAAR